MENRRAPHGELRLTIQPESGNSTEIILGDTTLQIALQPRLDQTNLTLPEPLRDILHSLLARVVAWADNPVDIRLSSLSYDGESFSATVTHRVLGMPVATIRIDGIPVANEDAVHDFLRAFDQCRAVRLAELGDYPTLVAPAALLAAVSALGIGMILVRRRR